MKSPGQSPHTVTWGQGSLGASTMHRAPPWLRPQNSSSSRVLFVPFPPCCLPQGPSLPLCPGVLATLFPRVFLSFPTSPNIRVLCGPAPLMGRLLEEGVVTSGQQLSLHSPSSPTEMWPLSLFCREMALPGLQQPQKSPPGACANSLTSVQVALLPSLPPLSIQGSLSFLASRT